MGLIFNFFFFKFVEAFFVGVLLRLILSLLFRQRQVSFWGFFNTGWVCGLIYTGLTYYIITKYY